RRSLSIRCREYSRSSHGGGSPGKRTRAGSSGAHRLVPLRRAARARHGNARTIEMTKRFLILLIAVLAACTAKKGKPPEERVPVTVATVAQKAMPVQLRAIGNVLPLQTVAVRALVGGQLTTVWFREGDEVRRGETLFTID